MREFVFTRDPVKDLLGLCIRESTDFTKIICIAHNTKAFDSQFILKELAQNPLYKPPSVILKGQNVTLLKYGRTKFIDSINYFQMKLSALTVTFGLPPSSKKGYFQHLFNTVDTQDYIGPLPPVEFYGPDSMSVADREIFLAWHSKTSPGYIFDMKKEFVVYCQMDVASVCSYVYRKNFLTPNTIGLIPPNGYRRADRYSQKSIEWVLFASVRSVTSLCMRPVRVSFV